MEIGMPLAVLAVAEMAALEVLAAVLRGPVMAVLELPVIIKAVMPLQILVLAVAEVPQVLEPT
jgi:hypothetical protein